MKKPPYYVRAPSIRKLHYTLQIKAVKVSLHITRELLSSKMSQRQPRRPEQQQQDAVEPIKYGDVLPVSGELASKPIAPKDAAMMQTAENAVLGQTQKGGPAATMQSAAAANERAGLMGHGDVTDAAGHLGVTVTETEIPGARIITESVGGQVVTQFSFPYVSLL